MTVTRILRIIKYVNNYSEIWNLDCYDKAFNIRYTRCFCLIMNTHLENRPQTNK